MIQEQYKQYFRYGAKAGGLPLESEFPHLLNDSLSVGNSCLREFGDFGADQQNQGGQIDNDHGDYDPGQRSVENAVGLESGQIDPETRHGEFPKDRCRDGADPRGARSDASSWKNFVDHEKQRCRDNDREGLVQDLPEVRQLPEIVSDKHHVPGLECEGEGADQVGGDKKKRHHEHHTDDDQAADREVTASFPEYFIQGVFNRDESSARSPQEREQTDEPEGSAVLDDRCHVSGYFTLDQKFGDEGLGNLGKILADEVVNVAFGSVCGSQKITQDRDRDKEKRNY